MLNTINSHQARSEVVHPFQFFIRMLFQILLFKIAADFSHHVRNVKLSLIEFRPVVFEDQFAFEFAKAVGDGMVIPPDVIQHLLNWRDQPMSSVQPYFGQ